MRFKTLSAYLAAFIVAFSSFTVSAESNVYLTRERTADILITSAAHYKPYLKHSDLIHGYEDGSSREEAYVTYAEMLVMLDRAFGEFSEPKGHNKRTALTDQDFTRYPEWVNSEIDDLEKTGIVEALSPDRNVTATELNTLIGRVYSYLGDDKRDDFYSSVNKTRLNESTLPNGAASTGTIISLNIDVNTKIADMVSEILQNDWEKGTREQKISDYYKLVSDLDTRSELGIEPIRKYLDMIDNVKTVDELIDVCCTINEELTISPLFYFGIEPNIEDSNEFSMYFRSYGPFFQKQFYNLPEESEEKKAFKDLIKNILILGGNSEETALAKMTLVYSVQKQLSDSSLDIEEYRDLGSAYGTYSFDEIRDLFGAEWIDAIYDSFGYDTEDSLIISDIGNVRAFADIMTDENINALKAVLEFGLLNSAGECLSYEFNEEHQKFSKIFYDTEGDIDREDVFLSSVKNMMSEYIAELYVEKYFSDDAKNDVSDMINTIIQTYKERINSIDWLSSETKSGAVKKLDHLRLKIGYPEYRGCIMDMVDVIPPEEGGTYFATALEVSQLAKENDIYWQFEKVDKDEWNMLPYTVNALYDPLSNSITVPAAVIQPPVYSPEQTYEENLAKIGVIIAHEVSHAFDDIGSQFDENGSKTMWWKNEDKKIFADHCKKLIGFYDKKETIPDVALNGELTLGENIADLGGMCCLVEILSKRDEPDWKKFFEAYAEFWFESATRNYYVNAAQTDVHGTGKLRVNRVLSNLDIFYDVYGINENDGMYEPPENRIVIW